MPAATCGFGTQEDPETGQCVPASTVCTDGTVFEPLTSTCKIDPAACQNGTVLIDGACADPSTQLVIDVQEGPEPNGLGILEVSEAQAGNIALKPAGGDAYVMHGTIDPWRDGNGDGMLDPDVDTYVLSIPAPAWLRITADGLHGMAAGFVAVAAVDDTDSLANWERVGLSLVSDASVREVLLPRAGTYRIAVADTRTLVEYVTTGVATAAPGGANAEYYVSIAQVAMPTPTVLTPANGTVSLDATLAGDKLALYTVPLGTGLNTVQLAMPSELAHAALVVLRDGMFAAHAVEVGGVARALVGDVEPTTTTTIVVDHAYTLLPVPASFSLDITVSNAPALSTTGDITSALATTNVGTDVGKLNLWSFEVASADEILAMHVAWSHPMVGEIYDSTGQVVASFTPVASGVTWSTYRGLVRFADPGRYYFAVFAPSSNASTMLSVTSTIAPIPPPAVAQGTPLGAAISPTFRSVPFTYAAGAAPWQQFDVAGVSTGGHVASWFDPVIAYGRLDPLVSSAGTLPSEIPPIFSHEYAVGGGPFGHVMLADGTQDYLVTVNAISPGASPSITLDFEPRAALVDLGTQLSGSVSRMNQVIDSATPQRFYLFRTTVGKSVTITVTPTSNVNTQFQRLDNEEAPLGALINTSTNGADVETFTQSGTDWTAFVVGSAGNLAGARTFDVSVQIQ